MKMVSLSFVALAILACSVATVAEYPVQNQAPQTTGHNQDGQTKKNDSRPAPTVKPEQNVPLQPPTTEERNESIHNESSEPDWWSRIANVIMAIGTVALAVIGAIAACIAIKTLRYIGVQTKHAGIAAEAARDGVQAILDSERPWLLLPWGDETLQIKEPYLIPAEDVPAKDLRLSHCMFFLKNYGKSPAIVVEELVELQVSESAVLIPDVSVYERSGTRSDFVFAQGAAILTEAPLKPVNLVTPEQYRDIFVNKSRFVWLCGYFKYTDTFNRTNPVIYETRLCFLWETRLNSPKPFWTMAGPPKHNRAT